MVETLERALGLFTGAEPEILTHTHREMLSKVHERATRELMERVVSFRERPVLTPGLTPSPEALGLYWRRALDEPRGEPPDLPVPPLPIDLEGAAVKMAMDPVLRKWMFLSGQMNMLSPPFLFGLPGASEVTPSPKWYPVSVAHASPADGRMDLGVLADHGHGRQEFLGFNFSEVGTSINAMSPITVQKPSTLTVHAVATVDAVCQGWAVAPGEVAAAALQLFLTVTSGTGEASSGLDVDVTMVKQGEPLPVFSHHIAGKSFELKQTIDLPASSLVMFSLSAKATALATKSAEQGWNCYGVVDAEGLARPDGMCKPKGEYYPLAGGIRVRFFAYQVVPM